MFAKNFPPNSGSWVAEVSHPCIFKAIQLPLLWFWKEHNREINANSISFSASAQDTKGFLQHYYPVSLLQPGIIWPDAATSIFTKKEKETEW